MGKYTKFARTARVNEPIRREIHPIWRGIGCLLMILIPIMSYAGAILLVQANLQQGWLPMPAEMSRTVVLPLVGGVPNLYANLIVTVLLMLIGFGILTVLYGMVYRVVGPPQLGPLDAPPERRRPRRR